MMISPHEVGMSRSPREAALRIAENNGNAQFEMNKQSGGVGEEEIKTIEVPQFPSIGGIQTAYTTSGLSQTSNLTNLVGAVDASNDRCVREDCSIKGGSRKKIRSRKH